MPTPPRPQVLRIGLTGGIGSGKSEAAGCFARRGVTVIDTDKIAHALTGPGTPATIALLAAFGDAIRGPGESIDRAKLRALVFTDVAARRQLETVLHPLIRELTQQAIASAGSPYCIVVVPLLIEAGFTDLVDRVLVIDADPAEQIRRTCARSGLDEGEVRRILATQLDRGQRLKAADDVIRNDSGLDALDQAVSRLHARYLELARARPGIR